MIAGLPTIVPAASPPDELVYRIDAADRLCHVNDAWDAFAHANEGGDVASSRVLGRSLWCFVGEAAAVELYRRLVAAARAGRAQRLRFRCDAPAERRLLELSVAALADGAVEFRTRPIAVAPRPREALLDADAARRGAPVRACSWCNRVWTGAEWAEVEVAVERLHLMLRSVLPPLEHGTCDACAAALRGAAPSAGPALLFTVGDDPHVLGTA